MRIDAIPNLNSDFEAFVARLRQHRNVLADQIAALDKVIAVNAAAADAAFSPLEPVQPGEGKDLPEFLDNWRKDSATGRPQLQAKPFTDDQSEKLKSA